MYLLFSDKIKAVLSLFMCGIVFTGIINTFLFFGSYGMLSRSLTFPAGTDFSGSLPFRIGSILAAITAISGIVFAFKAGKTRILSSILIVLLLGGTAIGIWKAGEIQKGFTAYRDISLNEQAKVSAVSAGDQEQLSPVIALSKTGKNVVIIMLDRAVGSYLPLIFEERKELASAFAGFTYYPNTVSFFRATNLGAPPLFGGYEYTPEKLHERSRELMADKHDESLLVLPVLFAENGYSVSFYDAPYVNYQDAFNSSFFTEKGISADRTMGRYNDRFLNELGKDAPVSGTKIDLRLRWNFVMFSIFSITPPPLRKMIYNGGSYWSAANDERLDVVKGYVIDSYAVLHYLPELTSDTGDTNSFTILVNNLTHDPSFLQYPGYDVVSEIDDFGPDLFNGNINSFQHYHVNAASWILLARWFDFLRSMGVYDNTRIIIASDHDEMLIKPLFSGALNQLNAYYNPILLVKDFNAEGELVTDGSFMTNADVPFLAVKDLIPDPRNPFSGNEITPEKAGGVNIFLGGSSRIRDYTGSQALDKVSSFYHVKDDIFYEENWEKVTKRY